MLSGKNILLGITGSIAAYKSLQLLRDLTAAGAEVHVVLTQNAKHFVPPLSLQVFSGHPVHTDLFEPGDEMAHIRLARKADLVLIAPVTAHFIAKMALGLSDDLLSGILLATEAPVMIAPAMDAGMWAHPAIRDHVSLLQKRGIQIIGPEVGLLASGKTGMGRFSASEEILKRLNAVFSASRPLMKGEQVLVTAGPTEEAIDPVRFISNRSSGKMGYALAETAVDWGADVVLISGPTCLSPPEGAHCVFVRSAEDMKKAVDDHLPKASLLIMAAAVSDYRPKRAAQEKLKKTGKKTAIILTETPDILSERPEGPPGQIVVGFAAETQNVIENARKKLKKKKLDLIVANNVTQDGAGFDGDTNVIRLLHPTGKIDSHPKQSKRCAAEAILAAAMEIRRRRVLQ